MTQQLDKGICPSCLHTVKYSRMREDADVVCLNCFKQIQVRDVLPMPIGNPTAYYTVKDIRVDIGNEDESAYTFHKGGISITAEQAEQILRWASGL